MGFACAPGRIRTCDVRIRSPPLCPLSYGGSEPVTLMEPTMGFEPTTSRLQVERTARCASPARACRPRLSAMSQTKSLSWKRGDSNPRPALSHPAVRLRACAAHRGCATGRAPSRQGAEAVQKSWASFPALFYPLRHGRSVVAAPWSRTAICMAKVGPYSAARRTLATERLSTRRFAWLPHDLRGVGCHCLGSIQRAAQCRRHRSPP